MAADLKRISEMETYLNECTAVTEKLEEALEAMDTVREPMVRLFRYYGSENWWDDRDAELPENFPAGVLSEDSVYDAVTEVREAAMHMLELATDILKNRI